MKTSLRAPAASASSAAYWISGLSTMGSISFGLALVAGRKRVPRPATGNTADRIGLNRDIILLIPIYMRTEVRVPAGGATWQTLAPSKEFHCDGQLIVDRK